MIDQNFKARFSLHEDNKFSYGFFANSAYDAYSLFKFLSSIF